MFSGTFGNVFFRKVFAFNKNQKKKERNQIKSAKSTKSKCYLCDTSGNTEQKKILLECNRLFDYAITMVQSKVMQGYILTLKPVHFNK